jgi:hypothetical protein
LKNQKIDRLVLAGLFIVLVFGLIILTLILKPTKAASVTVGVGVEFVSVIKTGNVSLGHPVTSPISTVKVEDGTIVVK